MSTITVKVGRGVGGVRLVELPEGSTVAKALAKASIDATGQQIRVGGRNVSHDHVLKNGDTVLALRKMRGA